MIKISIITVHLEDLAGLASTARTIDRLLRTGYANWVLIDGGTQVQPGKDQDTLAQFFEKADSYVSEPDNGIYNAMNKGTSLANGDYVMFLNAGDELHPDFSLSNLNNELGESRPAMIWGTCFERYPDGSLVKLKNRSPRLAWYGIPVNHQNVLFRRDLLNSAPYNEAYRYCADYDLISRLLSGGGEVFRSSMPFAIFQRGGTSAQNFGATMDEEERLRIEYFGVNPFLSRGISYLKKFNQKLGSVPMFRRWLRKWV